MLSLSSLNWFQKMVAGFVPGKNGVFLAMLNSAAVAVLSMFCRRWPGSVSGCLPL